MRIIAGRLKGRRLEGPTTAGVRPTSDRLRETLFNVLRDRVTGASVLDGFAGTGAVGLEALSRGAARATFVDRDPRVLRVLARNVAACGENEACIIIRDDFVGVGARHAGLGPFDLVIVDPPYDLDDLGPVVDEAAALVAAGGLVVLELSRRRESPSSAGEFSRRRVLTAGDSALAFYERA